MILRNEAKGIKQEGKKLLEPSRINAAFKDLSPCSGKLYLPWCWWFRRSVEFASLQCHGLQLTRLLCPWDFPGKKTGVGCHFLLQCMKVKVKNESEVSQLCPTLSDPMDCSRPGSSIQGIFQAKVLEWGAIAFSTRWLSGKEFACQCRRRGLDPWVRTIPWRREWQPTLVLLPGKSLGWRSLGGYSLWGRQELDTTERLHFHFL